MLGSERIKGEENGTTMHHGSWLRRMLPRGASWPAWPTRHYPLGARQPVRTMRSDNQAQRRAWVPLPLPQERGMRDRSWRMPSAGGRRRSDDATSPAWVLNLGMGNADGR